MSVERESLMAALLKFIEDAEHDTFDALANDVVRYQIRHLKPYARLCSARGFTGGSWKQAPLVPTALFREIDLCTRPEAEQEAVFQTSGTTGKGQSGKRRVPSLSLYHAGMVKPFITHVLGGDSETKPWLSLIPPSDVLPTSSLSHMVSELAEDLAAPQSLWAMSKGGLDAEAAWSWLQEAQKTSKPVVVLTTSFALINALDAYPERHVRLPAGSHMMLTGGFKGRSRTLDSRALFELIKTRLGLLEHQVIPEYGMTELTSQAYGSPFAAPPWLKLRVVDPVSHNDLDAGQTGLVAFFDLLNLDNVSAIVTSDLGSMTDRGELLLEGRAPGSVLRGCSLTAEELGITS